MLRADVEKYMKDNGLTFIGLVYNKDDKLGVHCALRAGKLYEVWDNKRNPYVVNRKVNIWGYLKYENGTPIKVAFEGE